MHLKKALEILMLDLCNADLKIIIYYLAKNSFIHSRPPLLKQDTSRFRLNLKCYFPCRYVLAILSFYGFCVSNAMRASLSVALVAMVNSSYSNVKAVTANNPECRRNTSEEPSKEVGDILPCNELSHSKAVLLPHELAELARFTRISSR